MASLGAREASDPRRSVTRGDMPYLSTEEKDKRKVKERGRRETKSVGGREVRKRGDDKTL